MFYEFNWLFNQVPFATFYICSEMNLKFILICCCILGLSQCGKLYHRFKGKKLAPSGSSGLSDLSTYSIPTLSSSFRSSGQCLGDCNKIDNCFAVQWQISTKDCSLFSITADSSSHLATTVDDADYVSYSVPSVGLNNQDESSGKHPALVKFNETVKAAVQRD